MRRIQIGQETPYASLRHGSGERRLREIPRSACPAVLTSLGFIMRDFSCSVFPVLCSLFPVPFLLSKYTCLNIYMRTPNLLHPRATSNPPKITSNDSKSTPKIALFLPPAKKH